MHSPTFRGDEFDPDRATGPWSGHRGFAYDLLSWRQPGTIVELGAHYGVSFFAFCQFVQETGASTNLHAVDTWQGDEHAGFYGEEVFETFTRNLAEFSDVSCHIHRSTFDEALSEFEDGSVDLIHIDGLHTYEAARHDFESWLPKLAPNGLMLLHDVAVDSGYGSADFYLERVAGEYPGFAFDHNFGLGVVLPKGTQGWDYLLGEEFARWRAYYPMAASQHDLTVAYRIHERMIEDRDEAIRQQAVLVDERVALIAHQDELIADRDNAIGAQARLVDERDHEIARLAAEVTARDAALANAISNYRAVSDQLIAVGDSRQRLELLEVSPKEQVKALRRSLPASLSKRINRARRGRRSSSQESARSGTHELRSRVDLPLLRQVTQHEPGLVSVDLWDTLIERERPADSAKTATARRMLLLPTVLPRVAGRTVFEVAQVRVDVEYDLALQSAGQEYQLREVVRQTLLRLGHPVGNEVEELTDALVEAEIVDEIESCSAIEEVAGLLDSLDVPVVIASDFYLPEDDLRRVVTRVAPNWADVQMYVSVDHGVSKRLDGALFEVIRREHGVHPTRHVHIGDNDFSDIVNQERGGGRAVKVLANSRFPAPGKFGPDDLDACVDELDGRLRNFSVLNPTPDRHRMDGRSFGLLAVALVARGLEEAWKLGLDRVHYVSREGMFLAQIHDLIEPVLRPPLAPEVRAVHLAVSRRSTFQASLEPPFHASMRRMWSMYAKQSAEAMLASIGLDPEEFTEELAAHGIEVSEQLPDASSDPRIAAFLSDPAVEAALSRHVAQARQRLADYIGGNTELSEPMIVVDIGWRGTIQDNLFRALGLSDLRGFYFGIFPFLNPQQPGNTKTAIAFDGNLGDEFAFAEPPAALERPWTPDVPSAVSYRADPSTGVVEPVLERESGQVSAGIASFQQGSKDVAVLIARWMSTFGITADMLKPVVNREARRLWLAPTPGMAELWFDSDHDDTFGAFNVTSFGKSRPDASWAGAELDRRLAEAEASSGWPAGFRVWAPVTALLAGDLNGEGSARDPRD